jgi:hypothetical protein
MRKTAMLSLVLLGVLSAWPVFAAKVVGEINYVSGEVSIIRNGKTLDAKQVKIGGPVEDFDLVRTGAKGLVELTVRTPSKEAIQLKVQSNTAFAIEMGKISKDKDQATFRMMSGTLALKVDKLSGSEVQVKTKSAAMGVRGTDFEVTTAPTEDLLVTCVEGEVMCTDANGDEESVKPGNVIELIADEGGFHNLPVTKAELAAYRQNWFVKRIEVFKAVAPKVVKGLSATFNLSYQALVKSYEALKRSGKIIDKWMKEDREGKYASRAELLREKKAIIGAIFKIKISLFAFEHVYYRLLELEYYVNQGYGANDPEVKQFFAELARKKQNIEMMMAEITYVFKLYAIRNDGYLPADALGTSDENFFDEGSDDLEGPDGLDLPGKNDKLDKLLN